MGVVYNFTMYKKKKLWNSNADSNRQLFQNYVLSTEGWANARYYSTLYEGYPHLPPCDPVLPDMYWYVNKNESFGVWVLNRCKDSQVVSNDVGWSPFVRKSVEPPFDPMNVPDRATRNSLTWIVDEQGFGQYGMVIEGGVLWEPYPNPNILKSSVMAGD